MVPSGFHRPVSHYAGKGGGRVTVLVFFFVAYPLNFVLAEFWYLPRVFPIVVVFTVFFRFFASTLDYFVSFNFPLKLRFLAWRNLLSSRHSLFIVKLAEYTFL